MSGPQQVGGLWLLCFLPSDPKSYLLTAPNDLLDVLINKKILVEFDYSCHTAGPPANNNDSFYIQRNRKICMFYQRISESNRAKSRELTKYLLLCFSCLFDCCISLFVAGHAQMGGRGGWI